MSPACSHKKEFSILMREERAIFVLAFVSQTKGAVSGRLILPPSCGKMWLITLAAT